MRLHVCIFQLVPACPSSTYSWMEWGFAWIRKLRGSKRIPKIALRYSPTLCVGYFSYRIRDAAR
jgi:hypothetical protein